jgi:hypothetical protein
MTPDDMERRTLALAAWLDSSTHEPWAFSSAQAASDLRALLLDYQERGRALERLVSVEWEPDAEMPDGHAAVFRRALTVGDFRQRPRHPERKEPMTPFMPTVTLSPDALVRIEGGEVVTWAECERRLAARTPAPEGVVACSGCEGHPTFPNVPCAVCGASPVVPVGETEEQRQRVAEIVEAAIERHAPTKGICHTLDDADAILAALGTKATDTGWRDIATAPKDGTRFLAVMSGFEPEVHWWDAKIGWCVAEGIFRDPEHWMPLPTAPTDTGREA